ncbi:MAG: cell envelope integrity protein TolA [Treponema sp.]|nr:cell envelope integrity protein TolA [Treponema sp.]
MLSKRTFAVIFLAAAGLAGFAQPAGNVVVLQTELQNISGNAWLPNHLQSLLEENVQKYTDFSTVVDEAAERKVKEQQRRSESTAHSESDIIEIGKLVNAKYALFSSARKAGSAYTLSIDFTDLTTGVHRVSITSKQYSKLEELYARPGAVDEVTLALCGRLDIALSAAERYVLQHGEADLSVSQQLELEKKEQERFSQQMKELDAQIAVFSMSVKADAETQKKKLEAQKALNAQKLKAAQERERRLLDEQKKRQADMVAEANRKEAAIKKRNSMIDEIERKVKDVRAAKVQGSGIMERIAFLEMKKKTFNELQAELSKRKEEIDSAADAEFKVKKAEVEARPWRAAELSGGKPTSDAAERRSREIETLLAKLRSQADKEKAAVEKEMQPASTSLLAEIVSDYQFLEKTTVTISSIKNEKDMQYSIGAFDGNTNAWPVLLYFYNDGKESLGQYQASISYQDLTGKKPFSEMQGSFRSAEQEDDAYNEFLDAVDMYNSLFARSEPVLTFEVDYTVEPWSVPSQYQIRFRNLRIKDTLNGKILHSEETAGLEKIVSFPECYIPAEYYAGIVPSSGKNVPSYLLYEFALSADKIGNESASSSLMRRAAEKGYAPALNYFAQKDAEEKEHQRTAAEAKAAEEEQLRQEKEAEKQMKKIRNDGLYDSRRLGFSLSGDFSPAVQNYALELKYFSAGAFNLLEAVFPPMSKLFSGGYIGGGANTWLKDNDWDSLFAYILFGVSVPFKRIRPYIELGGGIGSVKIREDADFGCYGYVKGGLELRVSPRVSIDLFCKPQGYTYSKDVEGEESSKNQYAGAVSGGASITLWKLFDR